MRQHMYNCIHTLEWDIWFLKTAQVYQVQTHLISTHILPLRITSASFPFQFPYVISDVMQMLSTMLEPSTDKLYGNESKFMLILNRSWYDIFELKRCRRASGVGNIPTPARKRIRENDFPAKAGFNTICKHFEPFEVAMVLMVVWGGEPKIVFSYAIYDWNEDPLL